MHKSLFSGEQLRKPVDIGENIPYEYGIPYEWGALHVSKKANEAYSFVPLREGVSKDEATLIDKDVETTFRTDVYLLSPQEFDELPIDDSPPEVAGTGGGLYEIHKDGISIKLALSQDKETAQQRLVESVTELTEHNGGNINDVVTEHGIPFMESVGQDSVQNLVHEFSQLAHAVSEGAILDFCRAKADKKLLTRASLLGSTGLVGAGGMLGVGGAINGEVDTLSAVVALAYSGAYSYFAGRSVKQYLGSTNEREQRFGVISGVHGARVAQDIHNTYCTRHFDDEAAKMFESDDN